MPVIRKRSSWSTVPSRSFLHWSGPQLSFPAGDIWNVVIVYKVRFQNRMPLRSCAGAEETTSPSAVEASNTARILGSRSCCIGCQAPARRTSLAQETVDILRLVEVLGGIESDRLNQPRRGEVRSVEIGAVKRDAGERRATQSGAPQRSVGEIRILEGCKFEVDARQIRIAEDCPLEIAGF